MLGQNYIHSQGDLRMSVESELLSRRRYLVLLEVVPDNCKSAASQKVSVHQLLSSFHVGPEANAEERQILTCRGEVSALQVTVFFNFTNDLQTCRQASISATYCRSSQRIPSNPCWQDCKRLHQYCEKESGLYAVRWQVESWISKSLKSCSISQRALPRGRPSFWKQKRMSSTSSCR